MSVGHSALYQRTIVSIGQEVVLDCQPFRYTEL